MTLAAPWTDTGRLHLAGWILWSVPCGKLAPRLLAFHIDCKRWKKREVSRDP